MEFNALVLPRLSSDIESFIAEKIRTLERPRTEYLIPIHLPQHEDRPFKLYWQGYTGLLYVTYTPFVIDKDPRTMATEDLGEGLGILKHIGGGSSDLEVEYYLHDSFPVRGRSEPPHEAVYAFNSTLARVTWAESNGVEMIDAEVVGPGVSDVIKLYEKLRNGVVTKHSDWRDDWMPITDSNWGTFLGLPGFEAA